MSRALRVFPLVIALLWAPSLAATIVVDPSGGGDATTIQAGVSLANAGNEVLVQPGIYRENVTLRSGVSLCSASGAEVTVIDGAGGSCVSCVACTGAAVIGFTLTRGGGYCGGGVYVFDGSEVEIAHNRIVDNVTTYEGAGVQVQRNSRAHIHDNEFTGNRSFLTAAISIIVASHADIVDNLFTEHQSDERSCIGMSGGTAVIAGNVFYRNRVNTGCVSVWDSATATVAGNTFLMNTGGLCSALDVLNSRIASEWNLFAHNHLAPAVRCREAGGTWRCNLWWRNEADCEGLPPPASTGAPARRECATTAGSRPAPRSG